MTTCTYSRRAAGFALLAAGLIAFPAMAGSVSIHQVRKACAAEDRIAATVDGIDVTPMPAAAADLPFLQVSNRKTGARVRIYHDPALETVAKERAACLGGVLAQLPSLISDTPAGVEWMPIVLTVDRTYVPPRTGPEHRWIVPDFNGGWNTAALRFLIEIMPHEETHGRQTALRAAPLPRWFQEGHAEWVSLHAIEPIRPDLVAAARRRHAEAAAGLLAPRLGAWGGRKVKPEAIERQLSPADRERRARDPSWTPTGTFNFRSGDFVEDNDDEEGRYAAALALFDSLERRHGRRAIQAWAAAVLKSPDNNDIAPLAQQMLGEDIGPALH